MAAFLSLLRRLYLTAYNWILFAGWCQVLFLTLKTLKESGHAHVYSNIQKPLLFAQTAALLEVNLDSLPFHICLSIEQILHCIVGLVRSPISTTVPQISSRLYMVWGILYSYPEESGLYSVRMPNKWNFSFSYFYVAFGVLAVYVPGVPHLYNHMLRQRKKTLSKPKEE